MGQPIRLRNDYCSSALRALARASKDADWTRRLLALSLVYDVRSRSEAAAFGGVGLQIVRDWCIRFNAPWPGGSQNRPSARQAALVE